MLIHPIKVSEQYPIGSIIEAFAPPESNEWLYCNGQELAQADYPDLYALIEDPHPIFQHWEPRYAIDSDYTIYEVEYGISLFVGASSGAMVYSSDGDTWTGVDLATYTEQFMSICFDGTTFVSVPDASSLLNKYVTSTDGTSWTERTFAISLECHEVVHDGTNFYIVSYDDGYTLYSASGTSWTAGGSLPDSSFYGLAASVDVVVTIGYSSSILAVSTDSIATWKLYSAPFASCREINYDPTDDVFVVVCGYEPVYAVSPGDDGVNWDVRHLSIPPEGNERGFQYGYQSYYSIKKAGNYWFALSWTSQQIGYSEDLITWKAFPVMFTEWYDVIYNSSTGYYYLLGYGGYTMRWKEVDQYDTGTHFKLPLANNLFDPHSEHNKRRYIRVK